ncbi:MAG: hypothetical protein ISR97_00410 [Nitrospira sp.]|nr:hypothetical protein [Nitrospira sp.]
MDKLRYIAALFFLAAAFLAPLPVTAMAADFAFNVPYDLHNIHASVERVQIVCSVHRNVEFAGLFPPSRLGDSGYVEVPIGEDRSASGTVTVPVSAQNDELLEAAGAYSCHVSISCAQAFVRAGSARSGLAGPQGDDCYMRRDGSGSGIAGVAGVIE